MAKKQKKLPPIHPGQSVSEAFAAVLWHSFRALLRWEKTAKSWQDIEGVHQVRVSLRRMRSALTVFRPAIPRDVTANWGQQMRHFASTLGPARDLDVFISEGLQPLANHLPLAGAEHLMAVAERHRAMAYEPVGRMLESAEYRRFKQDFRAWLKAQGWQSDRLSERDEARLSSRVATFARKILDRRLRKVLKAGHHANQDCADEMHRLRIECKNSAMPWNSSFPFLPVWRISSRT